MITRRKLLAFLGLGGAAAAVASKADAAPPAPTPMPRSEEMMQRLLAIAKGEAEVEALPVPARVSTAELLDSVGDSEVAEATFQTLQCAARVSPVCYDNVALMTPQCTIGPMYHAQTFDMLTERNAAGEPRARIYEEPGEVDYGKPWIDEPEPAIDPSMYPRVRVQSTTLYGVGRIIEYTAAEPFVLGDFVFLREDGYAIRHSLQSTARGLVETLEHAPPMVGMCVGYIAEPPRKVIASQRVSPGRIVGTLESEVSADGFAWVKIGGDGDEREQLNEDMDGWVTHWRKS